MNTMIVLTLLNGLVQGVPRHIQTVDWDCRNEMAVIRSLNQAEITAKSQLRYIAVCRNRHIVIPSDHTVDR